MEDNYDDWKWWQQAHDVFGDAWDDPIMAESGREQADMHMVGFKHSDDEELMLDMGLTPEQALFQWEVLKDLSKLPLVNEL